MRSPILVTKCYRWENHQWNRPTYRTMRDEISICISLLETPTCWLIASDEISVWTEYHPDPWPIWHQPGTNHEHLWSSCRGESTKKEHESLAIFRIFYPIWFWQTSTKLQQNYPDCELLIQWRSTGLYGRLFGDSVSILPSTRHWSGSMGQKWMNNRGATERIQILLRN